MKFSNTAIALGIGAAAAAAGLSLLKVDKPVIIGSTVVFFAGGLMIAGRDEKGLNAHPENQSQDSNKEKEKELVMNAMEKLKVGDQNGALDELNQAIEVNETSLNDPQSSALFNIRGGCQMNLGNLLEATNDFNKAIDINSNNASAYFNRGACNYKNNDLQGAINDFNKSIEINPNNAKAYFNLGNLYLDSEGEEEAIPFYTNSIEVDPSNSDAYFNRGLAYEGNYDFEEAVVDFKKVIEIDPKRADAYYKLGDILYSEISNSEAESIKYLDKAIELDQTNAYAYFTRSKARNYLKDYEGALSDALKAYKIDPKLDDLDTDIASYYNDLGRHEDAIKWIDDEIAANRLTNIVINNVASGDEYIDASFYFERGRAQKALGDLKGACEDWKKAAELGDEDTAELLKQHCE